MPKGIYLHHPSTLPLAERLDSNIRRDGADGCWPWIGGRTPRGYGQMMVRRRRVYVHRLMLEEALGRPIRPGLMALHRCDNPPCCNPSHLYEGSAKDNARDMHERGRAGHPRGSKRPDVTRRLVTMMRSRGAEVAEVISDEILGWVAERHADDVRAVRRFGDRILRGDVLPELVA